MNVSNSRLNFVRSQAPVTVLKPILGSHDEHFANNERDKNIAGEIDVDASGVNTRGVVFFPDITVALGFFFPKKLLNSANPGSWTYAKLDRTAPAVIATKNEEHKDHAHTLPSRRILLIQNQLILRVR